MARRRRAKSQKEVGDYRHDEARRENNPPAGIAPTYEVRERRTTSCVYDPYLDPQLQWAGKAEHTSFDVDVISLHIHERISTRAILDAVRRPEPMQLSALRPAWHARRAGSHRTSPTISASSWRSRRRSD
jgi:adenine-specific DNA-methyltransferase